MNTYTRKKYWFLGFLGFIGLIELPSVLLFFQDQGSAWNLLGLLWFLWFDYFVPVSGSSAQQALQK